MTVAEYMALPYTITLQRDEDGDVIARVLELRGCLTHGSTYSEALANIQDVMQAWIEMSLEGGSPIPLPRAYDP